MGISYKSSDPEAENLGCKMIHHVCIHIPTEIKSGECVLGG